MMMMNFQVWIKILKENNILETYENKTIDQKM